MRACRMEGGRAWYEESNPLRVRPENIMCRNVRDRKRKTEARNPELIGQKEAKPRMNPNPLIYLLQETTNHGTNIDISGKRKGKEKENLFQRNA